MKISISKTNHEYLLSISIALYFSGCIFAWYLQGLGLLPQFFDIGFVFAISAMLMLVYLLTSHEKTNFFTTGSLIWLLYFLVIVSLASFVSDTKVVIFCILFFVFSILFNALGFNSKISDLKFTVVANLVCAFYFLQINDLNLASIGLSRVATGSDTNQAFGVIAYSALIVAVGAAQLSKNRSKEGHILALEIFSFVFSFSIIFLAGVRSPYFGYTLMLIYWLYNRSTISLSSFRNLFLISIIMLISIPYLFSGADNFLYRIEHIYDGIFDGILTLFSPNKGADASAISRALNREYAYTIFMDNPLLGGGYKIIWIDFPLLQAFSDLGVLFGIVYFSLFFLMPLVLSLYYFKSRDLMGLFSLIYLANFPRLFLHGQPYDWQHLVYVVPIVAAGVSKLKFSLRF